MMFDYAARFWLGFCAIAAVALVSTAHSFDVRSYLGTKTPYDYRQESSEICNVASACVPEKMYLLARHGTRYPTEKKMRKLRKFEESFKFKDLVSFDFHFPTPFYDIDEGLLTPDGIRELRDLGERFASRFPSLVMPYHPRVYDIYSTEVLRTSQSAHAFAEGFFGGGKAPVHLAVVSKSGSDDKVLRFHKTCPRYLVQVKNNATLEGPESEAGRRWAKVSTKVSKMVSARMGIGNILDADTIMDLWRSCVYQASSLLDTTGVCRLFDQSSVEEMEYVEDLDTYWRKGYGHTVNYGMACLLLKQVVEALESPSNKLATMRFAHAETLLPAIAALGLYKDSAHLRADEPFPENRKWRTSMIVPKAASLAFMLCDGKVHLFHNEVPVRMSPSICPQKDCTLDDLRAAFGGCDYDAACGLE